jgi:DNA polymerase-3 subunit gamma/tau
MGSMAYVSLYRKYRPQTFADILGQEHVSQTLANAITEGRVAHAYLFTGPRGTGKTSTARILAKALNCKQGPTPSPCGKCPSCIAITEGSSLDVIEMDAASHSKVDETREILAGVALATTGGHKKIYVIDEVHMLSAGSFNALLKTLEEPPGHVIFVLATTEAHKVLSTIVSRTQRFDFRRVPTDVIEQHLGYVAKEEGIDIEQGALGVIARHADGGVRDALSALDQLSSISGSVTSTDAEGLLGGRHEDSFFLLFDAVADGDVGTVLVTVHSLMSQGADARQLALEALGHVRALLLLGTAPDAEQLLDASGEDAARLRLQADRFQPDSVLRFLDLLGKAVTDMRESPNHRLLLEVALVRAAAPETDPSATGLLGRIERLERRLGIQEEEVSHARAQPQPVARTSKTGTAPRSRPAPKAKAPSRQPQPAEQPAEKSAKASDVDVPPQIGFGHIRDSWAATMQEVGKKSKRIQGFLNPSRPLRLDDGVLVIEVQARFHADEMAGDENRSVLADALHAALGIKPELRFSVRGEGEDAPETGGNAEEDHKAAIEDADPSAEEQHDPVELVKKDLGAEVVEERTS